MVHRVFVSLCFVLTVFLFSSIQQNSVDANERNDLDRSLRELVRATAVYDEPKMETAIAAISEYGTDAIPPLIVFLNDEDSNLRWQAILAIQRIGIGHPRLPDALSVACRDADADVRAASLAAMLQLFPRSKLTKCRLLEGQNDAHDIVKCHAFLGLWQLESDVRSIDQLAEMLTNKDWMVAELAAAHLAKIGDPAVSILVTRLSKSKDAAAPIVKTLGSMRAASAVDVVAEFIDSNDPILASTAANSLARIGEPAVELLDARLHSKSVRTQVLAIRSFGQIGVPASRVSPRIQAMVNSPSIQVRVAALNTLSRIGFDSEFTSVLTGQLRDSHPDIRASAANALRMAPKNLVDRTLLKRISQRDPSDAVRKAAGGVLVATSGRH